MTRVGVRLAALDAVCHLDSFWSLFLQLKSGKDSIKHECTNPNTLPASVAIIELIAEVALQLLPTWGGKGGMRIVAHE